MVSLVPEEKLQSFQEAIQREYYVGDKGDVPAAMFITAPAAGAQVQTVG